MIKKEKGAEYQASGEAYLPEFFGASQMFLGILPDIREFFATIFSQFMEIFILFFRIFPTFSY
ncbi:MAG: hypothetical protein K8R45_03295 [Desulfobacterales bacterium]|nr:hypothetical protein [Desulfobacterales bacterium]